MARLERQIKQRENGKNDYAIKDGDFVLDDSFDTDLRHSLFVDQRATQSEVAQPEDRRGWFGDEFSSLENYLLGSKYWLLEQSRLNQDTLNRYESFGKEALQHFIDTGKARQVNVLASRQKQKKDIGVKLDIEIIIDDNRVEKFTYDIWRNSEYV